MFYVPLAWRVLYPFSVRLVCFPVGFVEVILQFSIIYGPISV